MRPYKNNLRYYIMNDFSNIKSLPKQSRLKHYFNQDLRNEDVFAFLEVLDLTEQDTRAYQKQKEQEVSMKPSHKRDLVVREVVKPLLKSEGFKTSRQDWWKELDDCWLMIHMTNSQFNDFAMGTSFRFQMSASKKEEIQGEIANQWIYNQFDSLTQFDFLPYCGLLSPYYSSDMYKIDGYKNYLPSDEPIENILAQIGEDFADYILPDLAKINTFKDWERLRKEKRMLREHKDIRLLSYYHLACMLDWNFAGTHSNMIKYQKEFELTADDIKAHFNWLEAIEKNSAFPNLSHKSYILELLELSRGQ